MILKNTYQKDEIHGRRESTYRGNTAQDRLNDKIMDRIMDYLKPSPDAVFLDVGCGDGEHSTRIAVRGYRCVGIDISEKIL